MNEDIKHLQSRIRELENKINLEPTVFKSKVALHQKQSVMTTSAGDFEEEKSIGFQSSRQVDNDAANTSPASLSRPHQ